MRVLRVQVGKMPGQLEQIDGKRHPLCQGRLVEFGLLRLAAKVEIGEHAPLFQWLNLLDDGLFDAVADAQKLIAPAGKIGKDYHEEDGRFAAPVVPERGNDIDHVRGEVFRGSRYCRPESGLLGERRWNVHHFIIARSSLGAYPDAHASGFLSCGFQ